MERGRNDFDSSIEPIERAMEMESLSSPSSSSPTDAILSQEKLVMTVCKSRDVVPIMHPGKTTSKAKLTMSGTVDAELVVLWDG